VLRVFEHILLLLSGAALWAAALAVASLATPRRLEQVVAAAPLAASAAVGEALVLGLLGLGGSAVGLALAAGLTYLVATRINRAGLTGLGGDLARWWPTLTGLERIALGALLGALAAWTVWMLQNPLVGADAIYYHATEVVMWVQQGTPGSVETITETFPVGNYPVTNEVLLAWAAGLGRSFVPLTLWTPLLFALSGAAGWLGLRSFGVSKPVTGLALAALLTTPTVMAGTNGPNTELPALAWLLCAAALAAASRSRPALLAPAVVAAGLAVGTKTTTATLALLALAAAAWYSRAQLRRLARPLLLALALAAGTGGVWYVRNLISHGSPLWPFVALPGGDPVPEGWAGFTNTLLSAPRATLEGRVDDYLALLGGAALLLAAGLAAPLLCLRREVVLTAAATALAVLMWAAAPLTGKAENPLVDFSLTATRYLLPATAAATAALALASRGGRGRAVVASVALIAALAWNLERDAALGHPYVPAALPVLGGTGAGVLLVVLTGRLRWTRSGALRRQRVSRWAAAGLATVAVAVLLAGSASGYVERHAAASSDRGAVFDTQLTRWFASRSEFASGERAISLAPTTIGPLAGDRLSHGLELIPSSEPCGEVEARAREGWVVLGDNAFGVPAPRTGPLLCFAGQRPLYDDGAFRVFGPESSAAARPQGRE
jgi:hypothetical protein